MIRYRMGVDLFSAVVRGDGCLSGFFTNCKRRWEAYLSRSRTQARGRCLFTCWRLAMDPGIKSTGIEVFHHEGQPIPHGRRCIPETREGGGLPHEGERGLFRRIRGGSGRAPKVRCRTISEPLLWRSRGGKTDRHVPAHAVDPIHRALRSWQTSRRISAGSARYRCRRGRGKRCQRRHRTCGIPTSTFPDPEAAHRKRILGMSWFRCRSALQRAWPLFWLSGSDIRFSLCRVETGRHPERQA